jgi:hypothetical protein
VPPPNATGGHASVAAPSPPSNPAIQPPGVAGVGSGQIPAQSLPTGNFGWDPSVAVPRVPAGTRPPAVGEPDLRIRSNARWVILAIVALLVIAAVAVLILEA